MKILVTGGSGFIGRNLVEQFAGEFEVFAPTHGELELLDTDAVDSFFREHEINVVVHSATRPGHRKACDTSGIVEWNTRMFLNLARNTSRYDKMILITSGAVYDSSNSLPKMKEDYFDTHMPKEDSGYSKYICAKYSDLLGKVIELRPFGVFGRYEEWQIRFISNMICKALHDLPLTMKQNRLFDYIYIDDLVKVVRYFITHIPQYKAYNVTPDAAVELKQLAAMVLDECGKDLDIVVASPEMAREYSGDNTRLKQEIRDLSITDLREAIHLLWTWYSERIDCIDRQKLLFDL